MFAFPGIQYQNTDVFVEVGSKAVLPCQCHPSSPYPHSVVWKKSGSGWETIYSSPNTCNTHPLPSLTWTHIPLLIWRIVSTTVNPVWFMLHPSTALYGESKRTACSSGAPAGCPRRPSELSALTISLREATIAWKSTACKRRMEELTLARWKTGATRV